MGHVFERFLVLNANGLPHIFSEFLGFLSLSGRIIAVTSMLLPSPSKSLFGSVQSRCKLQISLETGSLKKKGKTTQDCLQNNKDTHKQQGLPVSKANYINTLPAVCYSGCCIVTKLCEISVSYAHCSHVYTIIHKEF
jgi:hypothetical protein